MGGWFSMIWEYFSTTEIDVLCVGLSGSGKTTLTKSMKCERCDNTSPTMSLNIEMFHHEGVKIKVWDCGGQDVFRNSWATYMRRTKCDCLLFVIDSEAFKKDSHKKLVRKELHRMLKLCEDRNIPVLVISNKIDLPGHCSTEEMERYLKIQTKFSKMKIMLMEISATRGIGITGVLAWLVRTSKK